MVREKTGAGRLGRAPPPAVMKWICLGRAACHTCVLPAANENLRSAMLCPPPSLAAHSACVHPVINAATPSLATKQTTWGCQGRTKPKRNSHPLPPPRNGGPIVHGPLRPPCVSAAVRPGSASKDSQKKQNGCMSSTTGARGAEPGVSTACCAAGSVSWNHSDGQLRVQGRYPSMSIVDLAQWLGARFVFSHNARVRYTRVKGGREGRGCGGSLHVCSGDSTRSPAPPDRSSRPNSPNSRPSFT